MFLTKKKKIKRYKEKTINLEDNNDKTIDSKG